MIIRRASAAWHHSVVGAGGDTVAPKAMASAPPDTAHACAEGCAKRLGDLAGAVAAFSPPPGEGGTRPDAVYARVVIGKMKEAAHAMDAEATKLTVAFSAEPVTVEQCFPLTERFLGTAFVLTDLWHKVETGRLGSCLFKQLETRINGVFSAAKSFCAALVEAKGKPIRRDGAGWEGFAELADAAQRFVELPESNAEAVRRVLTRRASLLKDGYDELREAVDEQKAAAADDSATADASAAAAAGAGDGHGADADGDDDDGDGDSQQWSVHELSLMPNVLGAIKVALNALLKTAELIAQGEAAGASRDDDDGSGGGGADAAVAAVDTLPEIASAMCAVADDFVLASYAPVGLNELNRLALVLRTWSDEALKVARALVPAGADVPKWLVILERAAEHNQAKLKATSDAAPKGGGD